MDEPVRRGVCNAWLSSASSESPLLAVGRAVVVTSGPGCAISRTRSPTGWANCRGGSNYASHSNVIVVRRRGTQFENERRAGSPLR
jgi:hypothetical protein